MREGFRLEVDCEGRTAPAVSELGNTIVLLPVLSGPGESEVQHATELHVMNVTGGIDLIEYYF